jgi:hypothetical protein
LIFLKKNVIIFIESQERKRETMANKSKHSKRSKRSSHSNYIPRGMFAAHAQKVADAQFIKRMMKASEVAADAVDAE